MILTWRNPGSIRIGDQAIPFAVWPRGTSASATIDAAVTEVASATDSFSTPMVDVFYNHFLMVNEGAP